MNHTTKMHGQRWMNARRYLDLCCSVWSIMTVSIFQAIRKERFEKAIESETPTRKSMSADDIQVGYVRRAQLI